MFISRGWSEIVTAIGSMVGLPIEYAGRDLALRAERTHRCPINKDGRVYN